MTSSPITSWQKEGEKVEAVTDFLFLGSKNHYSDFSHEIKRLLAPWKETYDKPKQHIKKDISLLTKVHIVKAIVFSIVMDVRVRP